jgi:hypothetical protein
VCRPIEIMDETSISAIMVTVELSLEACSVLLMVIYFQFTRQSSRQDLEGMLASFIIIETKYHVRFKYRMQYLIPSLLILHYLHIGYLIQIPVRL